MPKFTSRVVATTTLARLAIRLAGDDLNDLLRRHFNGDWGRASESLRAANESALLSTGPLLSVFDLGTQLLWIITDAARGVTTVLLPEEYGDGSKVA
jgi:hypothetical protein